MIDARGTDAVCKSILDDLVEGDHNAADAIADHGVAMFGKVMHGCGIGGPISTAHVVNAFRLSSTAAFEFLFSTSLSEQYPQNEDAFTIMSHFGDDIVPRLFKIAQTSQYPYLRAEALRQLSSRNDLELCNILASAMSDPAEEVRAAAAVGIGEHHCYDAMPLLLNSVNNDRFDWECTAAIEALGRLKCRECVPRLIELLDADDMVRRASALALSKIGDQAALMPLIHALHKEGYAEAITALGMIGDPYAVRILMGYMADQRSWAYNAAIDALVNIGKPAVKPLLDCIFEANSDFHSGCVIALGRIGARCSDTRVIAPLLSLYPMKRARTMEQALIALEGLGPMALPTLDKMAKLVGASMAKRKFAAEAAGRIRALMDLSSLGA